MSDLTVFGLAEIFPKIPLILRRLSETADAITQQKPDLVITIDAPDFCFRLAKRLYGSGIRFVHYVAPTVWAWRPGRAKKIQPLYDHLLALFPFEPPYFTQVGLPCTFVGHPLVEAGIITAAVSSPRVTEPLLLLLPGSRRSELNALLPVFSETVSRLKTVIPNLQLVLATLPHLEPLLRAQTAHWDLKPSIVSGDTAKYYAMQQATLALAASGTVALELALSGTPSVVAYKVHPLTYQLYHRLIRVRYANLVNIMANELIVPEFLQHNCTADLISAELLRLFYDTEARQKQQQKLANVVQLLQPEKGYSPSSKAAEVLIVILKS